MKQRKRETDRQCVNGRWRKDGKRGKKVRDKQEKQSQMGFQVVGVEEIV